MLAVKTEGKERETEELKVKSNDEGGPLQELSQ